MAMSSAAVATCCSETPPRPPSLAPATDPWSPSDLTLDGGTGNKKIALGGSIETQLFITILVVVIIVVGSHFYK